MSEQSCSHIDAITSIKRPKRRECEECVKIGAAWVHLRTCQECGVTLCCDSSPTSTPANTHTRSGIPSSPRRSPANAGCIATRTKPLSNTKSYCKREALMARLDGLEKRQAPWHLRWFYSVMRKMFGKDLTPAKHADATARNGLG